jgi:DNA-binding transcriptional LysR family regulator
VLNAATVGMGLAVLPCFLADPPLDRLSPAVVGARDMYLVVRPDLAKIARIRAVMDFVIAVVDRERSRLSGAPAEP